MLLAVTPHAESRHRGLGAPDRRIQLRLARRRSGSLAQAGLRVGRFELGSLVEQRKVATRRQPQLANSRGAWLVGERARGHRLPPGERGTREDGRHRRCAPRLGRQERWKAHAHCDNDQRRAGCVWSSRRAPATTKLGAARSSGRNFGVSSPLVHYRTVVVDYYY